MSNYKIFDVEKAEELCIAYKKKRHYAKVKLLNSLISDQYFFGDASIVGTKVTILCICQKKTIESVLHDLGYNLTFYQTGFFGIIPGKSTIFTFIPKNTGSSEDN